MKKPKLPIVPDASLYRPRVEKKPIYLRKYSSNNFDCEESISLKWLYEQVPEGVDLDRIKFEVEKCFSEVTINFYYEEDLPARPNEYKEALKKYKEDMEIYKRDLKEYNEREKEIEELEERLKELRRN